jgi:predicted ATPase
VERIVAQIAGRKTLPPEVMEHLVSKSDGVPLFVEELTKAVLESGFVRETNGTDDLTGVLSTLPIPSTLHDSLMARLDRLGAAKGVAQLAATLGRTFSYELLRGVCPLDEVALQRELGRLVDAELLYPRGVLPQTTYLFKHALIQEAAYHSLLRSTRQQHHRRIAQVLAETFPEMAETQPELLAHHYTEAGLNEEAVVYWHRAGQRALGRSANLEAISHLTTGLEVLKALDTRDPGPRELDLQVTLALALHASKGQAAPEVARAYERARELCGQVEDVPQLFRVLMGLYRFYGGRMQLRIASELEEQLFGLAERTQDPDMLLEAHMARGTLFLLRGELVPARAHLERATALYNPEQHRSHVLRYGLDPGVVSLSRISWVLWLLGYPEQALRKSEETLTLAREVGHPHSLAMALGFAATLHHFRRNGRAAQELAEATLTLSTEQGLLQWAAVATFLRGWALTAQGSGEDGLAQMREGFAAYRAMGAALDLPWYLAVLAQAHGTRGEAGAALPMVAEALNAVDMTYFYEPELHRLRGQLLLMLGRKEQQEQQTSDVEAGFRQALNLARRQKARSLELRAAMSLSRLWQHQGKSADARRLLADVYGSFTEGFDTADLREAKALLEELS